MTQVEQLARTPVLGKSNGFGHIDLHLPPTNLGPDFVEIRKSLDLVADRYSRRLQPISPDRTLEEVTRDEKEFNEIESEVAKILRSSSGYISRMSYGEDDTTIGFTDAENKLRYQINFKKVGERYVFAGLNILPDLPTPKPANPPVEKTEVPPMKDLVDVINSQDSKRKINVGTLLNDPSLRELRAVYIHLLSLEEQGKLPKHENMKDRVERAAWISRNLSSDGKAVSADEVLRSSQEIDQIQKSLAATPILSGRSGVLLAHMQTLAETKSMIDGEKEDFLTPGLLKDCRMNSGDDHIFGRSKLVAHFREQLDSLTFLRPQGSFEAALVNVLKTHSETLARWHIREGRQEPTNEEITALKADLMKAMNMAPDAKIVVQWRQGKEGEGSSLGIYQNEQKIFSASVLMEKGVAADIAIEKEYPVLPRSPEVMKRRALEQIREAAPGKSGFIFAFEGHGGGGKMYLSDGQPSGLAFVEKRDTVSISSRELAEAFLERSKKYPDEANPVVVLGCCHASDIAREVYEHIEKAGGKPPIIICKSEFGQFSYGAISSSEDAFTSDVFGTKREPKTLGDIFKAFERSPNNPDYRSNPSLYVPGPKNKFRQISGLGINAIYEHA